MTKPALFLMVGLPGSGKTTRARELEHESGAIRLSPDEWMMPLFGASDVDGRRDVLEGRLIWLATQVLQRGTSAILDFGLWGREERAALHWLAASIGATAQTVYLDVDPITQLARVTQRWREAPEATWETGLATLEKWRSAFQVPEQDELVASWRAQPPKGFETWLAWLSDRWPTSVP
ncbi:AAA family ATPase [Leifsonia aquatica]|uniref:AAA family ATPase n=1 Tax=Leifsonia aquatica TaxID=144185 RepID=UPI0028A6A0F8|nr:ATP-binding protein [Leifsonia aquatica]